MKVRFSGPPGSGSGRSEYDDDNTARRPTSSGNRDHRVPASFSRLAYTLCSLFLEYIWMT
jgi:hypothetical protein